MASLKTVDAMFSEAVESKKMPGIVAMAATDKGVLYEGAFGRRELGKDAPMTLDTVVWIASMTKAITATAAMQLVERGKLSLDAPAGQLAPGLAKAQVLEGFDAAGQPRMRAPKRPITLRHLLTHGRRSPHIRRRRTRPGSRRARTPHSPRRCSSIRARAGSTASTSTGSARSSRPPRGRSSTRTCSRTSSGRSG